MSNKVVTRSRERNVKKSHEAFTTECTPPPPPRTHTQFHIKLVFLKNTQTSVIGLQRSDEGVGAEVRSFVTARIEFD